VLHFLTAVFFFEAVLEILEGLAVELEGLAVSLEGLAISSVEARASTAGVKVSATKSVRSVLLACEVLAEVVGDDLSSSSTAAFSDFDFDFALDFFDYFDFLAVGCFGLVDGSGISLVELVSESLLEEISIELAFEIKATSERTLLAMQCAESLCTWRDESPISSLRASTLK
jgi:hypothetical protein